MEHRSCLSVKLAELRRAGAQPRVSLSPDSSVLSYHPSRALLSKLLPHSDGGTWAGRAWGDGPLIDWEVFPAVLRLSQLDILAMAQSDVPRDR